MNARESEEQLLTSNLNAAIKIKHLQKQLDDCKMLTLLTLSQVMSDRKASLAVGLSHSALSMIKNGKSYKQYRSML